MFKKTPIAAVAAASLLLIAGYTPLAAANEPASQVVAGASQSYGPIQSGETLGGIATKLKPAEVTREQMMVGLFQANKQAFEDNNMNRLSRGQTLTVPDLATLQAIPRGVAMRTVRSHVEKLRQVAAGPVAPAGLMVLDSKGLRMAPTFDPGQLAEHLIFEAEGYDLNQPTQEGTTGRHRLTQDEIQKACSLMKGQELDDKSREKVMALAAASIKYPEGGIKLGDWKKGRELAWSGFGYRTAHNPDDHSKREAGGNCYNCHQMATDRTGGDIGPSLTNYGKYRGASEDMLKYTYDVIYNPHVYFACTNMPRMGAVGVLNQKQIADIMAYLFDPNSPVNK